jgi:uncharacterized protein YdeI (YjbR/CyaY-like superfamily)
MAGDGAETNMIFGEAAEWESWLERNHLSCAGVWMRIAKKSAPFDTVRYPEVLELALCFGWIDGKRMRLDEHSFLQRFSPRRARSVWSQINRSTAERLAAEGRMRPAGAAEVDRAKLDGRWDAAYAPQSSASLPEDLERELERRPAARAFFETLSSQNRYAILFRLQDAKREDTRRRRLEKFVAMLEAREAIYP